MGFSRQEYWSGVPLCTKFKWKLKTRRKVTHRIKHKSFCQPENNIITVVSKSHPFSLYGDRTVSASQKGISDQLSHSSPLPQCTRRRWSGRNHQPITPVHQAMLVGEESSAHYPNAPGDAGRGGIIRAQKRGRSTKKPPWILLH